MVWGDFTEGRNVTLGAPLLRYQKRFAEIIAKSERRVHADPFLAKFGILKIGDLYRQQLRIHGWQFWNGRLPANQAAMFKRSNEIHGHATRSARAGIYLPTRDHRSISYRVPTEWASLTEEVRQARSLAAFKRRSKAEFLEKYRSFKCENRNCQVCI